jgi:hypothetical protein
MGNSFNLTSSLKEVEEVKTEFDKSDKNYEIKRENISRKEYKKEFEKETSVNFKNNEENHKINLLTIYQHLKPSISAGAASFVQCSCFYWCDLGKNRLQAGLTATIPELLPYKGFRLALLYIVAARSFGFGIFETTKKLLIASKSYSHLSETNMNLICATVTAISKPILLFPIETMKIIIQVKGETVKQSYISLKSLGKNYKIKSLYYLQLKNFISYFSWFETRKHIKYYFKHKLKNPLGISFENFITGSICSLTSFVCSSPFSTLKTLRQIGKDDTFRQLLNNGGKFRLHKGYQFHFMNIVGGGGVFNLVYSAMMESKVHI